MSDEEKILPLPAGLNDEVQERFERMRESLVNMGYSREALDLVTIEVSYRSNQSDWRYFNDGEPYTTYTIRGPSVAGVDFSRPFPERSAVDQAACLAFQLGINSLINVEDYINDGRHSPDDDLFMTSNAEVDCDTEWYKISTRRTPEEFMRGLGPAFGIALLAMKHKDALKFGAPKKDNPPAGLGC